MHFVLIPMDCSIIVFASIANFMELPLLKAITIGEMKKSSVHLFIFVIWPFCWSFLSSPSTWFSRSSSMRRPFWWMEVKIVLNFYFTACLIERPLFVVRFLYSIDISCFGGHVDGAVRLQIILPPGLLGCCCWIVIPISCNRSLQIIARWLLGTTNRSALSAYQPLHCISQYRFPLFLMVSFV